MLYLCTLCGFARKIFIENVVDPPEGKNYIFKILSCSELSCKQ
ncbi:hypothetical protein D1BOALGB6SA_6357 [Olavius sp. associated proteobacterium Delta 1]|nr:hypothetical protein D1BOALGB6SA_6357 [Olavius sp. associated proteobacterium Delta 1]